LDSREKTKTTRSYEMFKKSRRTNSIAKVVVLSLSLMIGFSGPFVQSASAAEPERQLTLPKIQQKQAAATKPDTEEDTLLVMVSADADRDEIGDAVKEVKGTVVETIGEGSLTTLVIRAEKGHLDETEKKLTADKHFSAVQRNFKYSPMAVPNDPFFANEWHLSAIRASDAWNYTYGSGVTIGVMDTGCNQAISDLAGKTYSGFNAYSNTSGQIDVHGHGSMVATTAAAITNNARNTAAPARGSYVYPIRISGPDHRASDTSIIRGILKAAEMNLKVLNLSFNSPPPYSLANKSKHTVLHMFMKWFHDQKGGLIFNSAGNDNLRDTSGFCPYLIVVSALGTNYSMTNFSTYGSPIWFTCPGQSIYCSNKSGQVVSVNGTSFASPLAASVCALAWSRRPYLTNTQMEAKLRASTQNVPGSYWNQYYGFGLLNARKAVQ
jgi:thermitase